MPDFFARDAIDWELFEEDWRDYCEWLEEDRDDAAMEAQYHFAVQEGLIHAYA